MIAIDPSSVLNTPYVLCAAAYVLCAAAYV